MTEIYRGLRYWCGDPTDIENQAEIARLRTALQVEKINNRRLQSERNNGEAEIARLQELNEKLGNSLDYRIEQINKLEADKAKLRKQIYDAGLVPL